MYKICYILFFFSGSILAQFNPSGPGNLIFEKVYQVELSKEEIRFSLREWIATTYNNPDKVTVLDSEDKIILTPIFKIDPVFNGYSVSMNVNYNLTAEYKEGRYKVTIDNIRIDNGSPVVNAPLPDFENYKTEIKKSLGTLPKDAKKQMEKLLNDEDKLLKMYNESVGHQKQLLDLIREHIQIQLIDELTAFTKNYKTESDW